MQVVKIILGVIAGLLVAVGFASWRLEFSLPSIPIPLLKDMAPYWSYILVGVALGAALVWGRIAGIVLALISIIPIAIAVFQLLFDKSMSFTDHDFLTLMGVGIGGLIIAGILYAVGSEDIESQWDANAEHARRSVVCSACSQYLGTAGRFQIPCPRCGSNRYDVE